VLLHKGNVTVDFDLADNIGVGAAMTCYRFFDRQDDDFDPAIIESLGPRAIQSALAGL